MKKCYNGITTMKYKKFALTNYWKRIDSLLNIDKNKKALLLAR